MLYQAQGLEGGRGTTAGQLCADQQHWGRLEGNTWHGHGRFGTYVLVSVFPKRTDRSLTTGGVVVDRDSCGAWTSEGGDAGMPQAISSNVDYDNVFVGQYGLGDVQYVSLSHGA